MTTESRVAEFAGELFALVFGWVVCMAMLLGAYAAGHATADYFWEATNPDTVGLLSAVTLIWIYEHDRANDRWNKLLERAK